MVLKLFMLSLVRHLLAGSDGPWTLPRMPTTRTRLRCWSVWTVWRKVCLDRVKVDSMVSRAGRRVRPHSSLPPVWFSTTARGRSLMCSPDPDLQPTLLRLRSVLHSSNRQFSMSTDNDFSIHYNCVPCLFRLITSRDCVEFVSFWWTCRWCRLFW